jgi:hypothetical protein
VRYLLARQAGGAAMAKHSTAHGTGATPDVASVPRRLTRNDARGKLCTSRSATYSRTVLGPMPSIVPPANHKRSNSLTSAGVISKEGHARPSGVGCGGYPPRGRS